MRQVVYQVCYTRYHFSFYVWLIGSVLQHCKVPKYHDQDCRSIYIVSTWYNFYLRLHFHYENEDAVFIIYYIKTKTDTLAFLDIFKTICHYFWMITWIKNLNNFQTANSWCCSAFAWFFANFSQVFLLRILLKESV